MRQSRVATFLYKVTDYDKGTYGGFKLIFPSQLLLFHLHDYHHLLFFWETKMNGKDVASTTVRHGMR